MKAWLYDYKDIYKTINALKRANDMEIEAIDLRSPSQALAVEKQDRFKSQANSPTDNFPSKTVRYLISSKRPTINCGVEKRVTSWSRVLSLIYLQNFVRLWPNCCLSKWLLPFTMSVPSQNAPQPSDDLTTLIQSVAVTSLPRPSGSTPGESFLQRGDLSNNNSSISLSSSTSGKSLPVV